MSEFANAIRMIRVDIGARATSESRGFGGNRWLLESSKANADGEHSQRLKPARRPKQERGEAEQVWSRIASDGRLCAYLWALTWDV